MFSIITAFNDVCFNWIKSTTAWISSFFNSITRGQTKGIF
ncbi:hypothetical protein GGI1_02902 [Acidithiobacillus sp. GGI-221]|nr:hypothetical protein GGI1_02902 [Acidithiobacillus sp. GGI-221]